MNARTKRPLLPFFLLVFLLSIPFWIAGYLVSELADILPVALPVSALMAFMPTLAAVILLWRQRGRGGAVGLLKRSWDVARIRHHRWLPVAAIFMPAILFIAWLVMRGAGVPTPAPVISLTALPIYFVAFFVAALGEELGWQGYAYDTMEARWTALPAALLLGAIWTIWHVIPYFQTGHDASWVAWHCGMTILLRVVTVWIYVNGGRSVFIAALFHAMCNVAYFSFPNAGSHYDPVFAFPVLLAVTAAIISLWGPKTLARFRIA